MDVPETYNEASIRSLDWKEHIRLRPGMYIGKLGDGSSPDDGIYVLIKEILDNSIDEFVMGYGKTIEVTIKDQQVCVRDYGRGMPLGKIVECVSKINTGAKYDSNVFKKAVGLNGVGAKAVNGLSSFFKVQGVREGITKIVEFRAGEVELEEKEKESDLRTGTIVTFVPDEDIFGKYHFIPEYVQKMLWNYVFLNTGLTIIFNGERFHSQNGLLDLLTSYIDTPVLYPVIHLKDGDFEFAFTHCEMYGEEYYSFVNGQHTTQGGTTRLLSGKRS
jgi:topoisomerase IV subunit B